MHYKLLSKILYSLPIVILYLIINTTTLVVYAAADNYQLLVPINGQGTQTVSATSEGFSNYLQQIINISIALAGVVSVIMLIVGGLEYVFSSVSETAKKDAKDRITNAILGLILALSGYLILSTINPDLLNLGLPSLKRLNPPPTQAPQLITTEISKCISDREKYYTEYAHIEVRDIPPEVTKEMYILCKAEGL